MLHGRARYISEWNIIKSFWINITGTWQSILGMLRINLRILRISLLLFVIFSWNPKVPYFRVNWAPEKFGNFLECSNPRDIVQIWKRTNDQNVHVRVYRRYERETRLIQFIISNVFHKMTHIRQYNTAKDCKCGYSNNSFMI